MYNPNLSLEQLFKPNSLRNLRTENYMPMAHSGLDGCYYITHHTYVDETTNPELKEILEKGDKWVHTKYSISSYIDLSDEANRLVSSRLIKFGPGTSSSSFHIYVNEYTDRVYITATGWGSSCIQLYDGPKDVFLDYLKTHQKREANKAVMVILDEVFEEWRV